MVQKLKETSKRIKIIEKLLSIINNDATRALRDPVTDIVRIINGVVGKTYDEVCMSQQTYEFNLEEAIKQLNINPQTASYIRLYRAYELFTGTLTSSNEDPNELCKNEIASSDDVIVNVIAKYFIERYSEEPPIIGHSPLVRTQE